MPTEITVRGRSSVSEPPERGTVHATISFEGPAMEPVYERVARDVDNVKRSVESLRTDRRTCDALVRTGSAHLVFAAVEPGREKLPVVYHARVDVEVEFRDFTELSRWITAHTNDTEGVQDLRRRVVTAPPCAATTFVGRFAPRPSRMRSGALSSMPMRSHLGQVRPVAVADAGMLSAGPMPGGGHDVGLMRSMAVGSAPEVELAPEDIEVSATVDARFVAG